MYLHGEHFDAPASSLDVGYETLLEIVSHTAHALEAVVADLGDDPGIRGEAIACAGNPSAPMLP